MDGSRSQIDKIYTINTQDEYFKARMKSQQQNARKDKMFRNVFVHNMPPSKYYDQIKSANN